ncbi:hypothetical protein SAMN02745195_00341 [Thermoanaerobacter uzonensis DSM 18761]|uniref:ABC-2 type transport system permease protein n=1 Tax=Thermoanaerobacter uzonensis DSM 18761 TaxID=1123369 RepID=A0A1M4TEJ3_9THEO|nr:hypothetical protein [Thermoanaerobacter uzonensis]SHE42910.1 hypothetical protein SAMN02745195_00341 [Thermoanaerobacter uzonensis DSM 18761]
MLKLIRLEFVNFLKVSIFPFILLNLVVAIVVKNMKNVFDLFSSSSDICTFYTLFLMIIISYAAAFMTTINFEKEKLSNLYHRYFVLPLPPGVIFAIKLFPPIIFSMCVVLIWGIVMFLMFHPVTLITFIMALCNALIFVVGTILLIFYFDLTLKNVSVVYGIKFILIFVLSYLPNFIISQNVSIKVVNYSIIIFTFLLFITGIILINNVDSEKVILS